MVVDCPLCSEYSGEPGEVEAHISGSHDEAHEGHIGSHFEDELREAGGDDEPDAEEPAGIPIPVPAPVLIGAVALFFLFAVWSGSSAQQDQEDQDETGGVDEDGEVLELDGVDSLAELAQEGGQ